MNIGVTLLGVLWVGMFGSFAALMLCRSASPGIGILLAAILGTVAYDIGGLFVGRNAGSKPLSPREPEQDVGRADRRLRGRGDRARRCITVIWGFGPIDEHLGGAARGPRRSRWRRRWAISASRSSSATWA